MNRHGRHRKSATEPNLTAGQHTFFVKVTTSEIAKGLKLESAM
jgi:hypothetical protein